MHSLTDVLSGLCRTGLGILAADEDISSLEKKFQRLGFSSSVETRRLYRDWLTAPLGLEDFLSGIIFHDETIRQTRLDNRRFVDLLNERGIMCGVKADLGRVPFSSNPSETLTIGLDDLTERLAGYRKLGAAFAKWRAAFTINSDTTPTQQALRANCRALALFATACHQQSLVPIVEPDVVMDGRHDIGQCEQTTGEVVRLTLEALQEEGVDLRHVLLKVNMVTPGRDCPDGQATPDEIAQHTLRCLLRSVPSAIPGVFFLSGGQTAEQATSNLGAIATAGRHSPWKLSFAFGRAMRDPAVSIWGGRDENIARAQEELLVLVRSNSLAARAAVTAGKNTEEYAFRGNRRGSMD